MKYFLWYSTAPIWASIALVGCIAGAVVAIFGAGFMLGMKVTEYRP